MIPKSGNRFSDQMMPKQKGMIPKSGNRFSGQIMQTKGEATSLKSAMLIKL